MLWVLYVGREKPGVVFAHDTWRPRSGVLVETTRLPGRSSSHGPMESWVQRISRPVHELKMALSSGLDLAVVLLPHSGSVSILTNQPHNAVCPGIIRSPSRIRFSSPPLAICRSCPENAAFAASSVSVMPLVRNPERGSTYSVIHQNHWGSRTHDAIDAAASSRHLPFREVGECRRVIEGCAAKGKSHGDRSPGSDGTVISADGRTTITELA
jgi:hypothetical protein